MIDDMNWDSFWALHEELGALISRRFRGTRSFDSNSIPQSPAECAIWEQLTLPQHVAFLEAVVENNPGILDGSLQVWKNALRDARKNALESCSSNADPLPEVRQLLSARH